MAGLTRTARRRHAKLGIDRRIRHLLQNMDATIWVKSDAWSIMRVSRLSAGEIGGPRCSVKSGHHWVRAAERYNNKADGGQASI